MSGFLQDKQGKMISQTIMALQETILPKKLVVATQKNRNSRENLNCHLAKTLLKKECMKMMKFITGSKSKGEEKSKKNKDALNNKTKEAIKSQVLQGKTTIRLYGIKSSLKTNLNPWQKNHQYPASPLIIKWLKTKVQSETGKTESMRNLG